MRDYVELTACCASDQEVERTEGKARALRLHLHTIQTPEESTFTSIAVWANTLVAGAALGPSGTQQRPRELVIANSWWTGRWRGSTARLEVEAVETSANHRPWHAALVDRAVFGQKTTYDEHRLSAQTEVTTTVDE